MLDRPYDLSVSEQELSKANIWWRTLSINQMKAYETKHFPNTSGLSKRAIHQIWEEEGKPGENELHVVFVPFALHVPALFELNEGCDEATGTIHRFCSVKCRDAYFKMFGGRFNFGSDTTYIPGEICTECSKPLVDSMFHKQVPPGAILSMETLAYLNDVWGPGFASAHDISPGVAQCLLDNAQDDVPANEHVCDKEGFNAYAVLHGLPKWDKITQREFSNHIKEVERADSDGGQEGDPA